MAVPIESKATIEPSKWGEFLRDFSVRNYNRRARFDVYRSNGRVEEEGREARLEDISLKDGENRKNIQVIRIDRSEKNTDKIRDTIENVVGVAVQYDTDGSEDVLEITDDVNNLISLRLESRVDGVS